jgi:hypothetical protein
VLSPLVGGEQVLGDQHTGADEGFGPERRRLGEPDDDRVVVDLLHLDVNLLMVTTAVLGSDAVEDQVVGG